MAICRGCNEGPKVRDQHKCRVQTRCWHTCAQRTADGVPPTTMPLLAGFAGLGALGQPSMLAALGGAAIGALVEHEHDKHHHHD